MPDTAVVLDADPRDLLRDGVLDAELAGLLWLLLEGGTPLVVTGSAAAESRAGAAVRMLSLIPGRAWTVIDADHDPPSPEGLAALLRGGAGFGMVQSGSDLKDWLSRAVALGLPEDGVRRLGIVVVLEDGELGPRCRSAHYLRPSERDGQGHVQRRPPAVLAAWDEASEGLEYYAWGITPELADRVDRSQADLEERHRDRTRFLESIAAARPAEGDSPATGQATTTGVPTYRDLASRYLAAEPIRVPAPTREPARPSPLRPGLTDPDPHTH